MQENQEGGACSIGGRWGLGRGPARRVRATPESRREPADAALHDCVRQHTSRSSGRSGGQYRARVARHRDLPHERGREEPAAADGEHVREEERAPAWLPDGRRIVFSCRRGGLDFEICVMNADGTGQVQLTDNDVPDLTSSHASRFRGVS